MLSAVNMLGASVDDVAKSILNSQTGTARVTNQKSDDETFDGIFNSAINLISSTNDYLQDAQKAEVAFATGELKSTHELAVFEQKANLSLQYTVAIKNQLISAYKEIMNMQI